MDTTQPTDDAFGGYRGMWRNAENEVHDLRKQLYAARGALRAIRDYRGELGGPPPDDAMREIARRALG